MGYVIATAGFGKSSGSRSRPEGMAHAVWPGDDFTACGLPVASSLFCYHEQFTTTELARCPLCNQRVLALPGAAALPDATRELGAWADRPNGSA
jgi:hypothetical protein